MEDNYDNIQLQSVDYKFLSSIKLSIFRALLGEVIPSLRAIMIAWRPGDNSAKIIFYHDGFISDAIQSHYSSIITVIGSDSWDYKGETIEDNFDILRLDYPYPLPESGYIATAYRRKEPFVDPS